MHRIRRVSFFILSSVLYCRLISERCNASAFLYAKPCQYSRRSLYTSTACSYNVLRTVRTHWENMITSWVRVMDCVRFSLVLTKFSKHLRCPTFLDRVYAGIFLVSVFIRRISFCTYRDLRLKLCRRWWERTNVGRHRMYTSKLLICNWYIAYLALCL